MERVPRRLRDLFHLIISERRRAAPALTDCVTASAFGRFERPPGVRGGGETRSSSAAAREAHDRGIRLLRENLSPAQRAQYEERGYFDVIGGETGRRYRISRGSQMNVYRLDKKGRRVCVLCFFPEGELVVGDVMLAQKLAIELFESQALKVANTLSPDDPMFYVIR